MLGVETASIRGGQRDTGSRWYLSPQELSDPGDQTCRERAACGTLQDAPDRPEHFPQNEDNRFIVDTLIRHIDPDQA